MLLNADVDLERIPRNGIDAYYMNNKRKQA